MVKRWEVHVDVCSVIQQRLKELGLEQRDLAAAADVTDSYISQLLTRKKAPPATNRTDIYERMNTFLKLPKAQLAALVDAQRQEEWKKKLAEPPAPLYREVRELVIRKCRAEKRKPMRAIFEKQAFGELERLVTQKLLDLAKRIAKDELQNERWLKSVAKLRNQSYQEVRTVILEFLDTDVFNISIAHCNVFLTPLIESWDIDLATFEMEVHLNRLLSPVQQVHFHFVERQGARGSQVEPGFSEFLGLPDLSADATEDEIDFLKNLKFKQRRPTAFFYYRELQNLRDPLNFQTNSNLRVRERRDGNTAEKRKQLNSRRRAIRRWIKKNVNAPNTNDTRD
jgi:transcriptional regulator with XRE-family HTH domain